MWLQGMIITLLIGTAIGLLTGLMAFLITYEEYLHHYQDRRKPARLALEAAAFTFIVSLVLTMIVGFVLTRTYMSQ